MEITCTDSLEFVDKKEIVDRYKCFSCGKVAIEHRVANCKHVFCSTCINDLFGKLCPVCENVKITEGIIDIQFEQGIHELNVECRNKNNGCQEIIQLRNFLEHETKCRFSMKALLPKVYRGQLPSEELKEISDDMEHVKGTIGKLQKEIEENEFSQQELASSVNLLKVKVETMRQNLVNMKRSLQDVTKQSTTTRNMVTDLVENMNSITKPLMDSKFEELERIMKLQAKEFALLKKHITGQSYVELDEADGQSTFLIWKITDFKQKLENMKNKELEHIMSEAFYTKEHSLKVQIKLVFDSDYIDIFLEWDPTCQVYWHARQFFLLDQSDRIDKKHVSIIDTPLCRKNQAELMMKPSFVDETLTPLKLLEKDGTYLRDDSIIIKVGITPLSLMYKTVTSRNGTLVWRIEDHASRKRDEIQSIQRFLNSEPFYTDPYGYRVLAHLHLDGHSIGKGKYITIYAGLIIGEFDQTLPFPVNCRLKFYLLDQSGTTNKQHISSKLSLTFDEECTFVGNKQFVLQSKAEKAPYLLDDSLFFKIKAKITARKGHCRSSSA